jgi:signal transduction histidine kinase
MGWPHVFGRHRLAWALLYDSALHDQGLDASARPAALPVSRMSAVPTSGEPQSPAVQQSIAEISRTLDALRERLRRLESGDSGSAPEPPAGADAVLPVDPEALAGVQEILAVPSSGVAPSEVFGRAMDRAARLLDADRAMLFVVNPERTLLVPLAARGFRRDDLGGLAIPPGEGVVGRAFLEGRPLVYTRGPESAPRDPFIARFPVRDALAVPVRADGDVGGVLFAGRRGRGVPFNAEDTVLLLVIADRVATAFAHQRLADRAADHLARLRELQVFSGQAVVGRDLADTLVRACEVGGRLLDVRVAALALTEGETRLRLAAASGLPQEGAAGWAADMRTGLAGEMAAAQQPVACRDVREREGAVEEFLVTLGLRGCLLVPLRMHDRTVGALYLADSRPRDFSADEVGAAQVLACLAALAVENERLYGDVRAALDSVKAAQERLVQSEKARALGGMAGGIAHEFNNILAIILGKTQLLLVRSTDETVREGLGHVEEAAWRAADIIRRLQGFAATRVEDSNGPIDLNALVHDAVTLTRGVWKDEAEARGVRIEVTTDLEDAPAVRGNAAELREAVTNLVLNAIDAMPRGGQLGLSTRPRDGGVELTVTDTGEGMSEEVRRRIFEPFFSTRSPLRTGLGLSVVHGIVGRHRGRVEVASEERRGTTVRVWLPAAGAPPPAVAAGATARVAGTGGREAPARPTGPARILVLEDEPQIREMLVDSLGRAGHRVESAADGLAGLARFQGGEFDVVLTDLSLPERSGLDVARAVKRMRPQTPVVLITGWGHLLDPTLLAESGVDLTLVKPFRLERVLSILDDALRLRRPA